MTAAMTLRLGWTLFVFSDGAPYLYLDCSGRADLHCLHNQPRTLALVADRVALQRRKQLIAIKAGDQSFARCQLAAALDVVAEQVRVMREEFAVGGAYMRAAEGA